MKRMILSDAMGSLGLRYGFRYGDWRMIDTRIFAAMICSSFCLLSANDTSFGITDCYGTDEYLLWHYNTPAVVHTEPSHVYTVPKIKRMQATIRGFAPHLYGV